MGPSEVADGGPGAGARVVREIIRTPAFAEILKLNLTGLEPEAARELVRTALWEDMNFSLSITGTAPDVINYVVEAVLELGRQLDNFPEPLLGVFAEQIAARIDRERLSELPVVWGPVLEKVGARDRAAVTAGRLISAGASMTARALTRDPYFIRDVISNIEGIQLLRAGVALLRSAALSLGSLAARFARRLGGLENAT